MSQKPELTLNNRPYGCLLDKASLQSEEEMDDSQCLEVRRGFGESELGEGFREGVGIFLYLS